ncbi:putative phage abortive infection protein [Aliarcobacter butzleri]|uniref:putative phage abortive infection protein n=1 Tax=Aliarcobacter butzleri TaxID=28197 RepID=UPI0021B28E73|nr:putative phage abortive infection protein [Aliarcobacter butzleri]MCT7536192.1 putative phage abortive infection protein [Aliarcobacter butzleri]MCT7622890.1 putative phage abortive infection protein [Aliarcobacter butzleri]MCT7649782.1 putative phage abortive infection protein [Aliarcobacter butzleri]
MKKIIKNFQWKWFLFLIPFIVIGFYFLYLNSCPINTDFDKAGKLGDSFGIINTLFSGLAFIALIITIYLQQQEIKESKEEIQKQNFETTFFNLIKIHNDVLLNLRHLRINDNKEPFTSYGYEALSNYFEQFKNYGVNAIYIYDSISSKEEALENSLKNRYISSDNCELNLKFLTNLKFIENIYSCLNLIDNANFIKDKKIYLETLYAQISDEELALIFYYTHGIKNKYKPLLEKYKFFENLDIDLLHNWKDEIKLYNKNAFDESLWIHFLK